MPSDHPIYQAQDVSGNRGLKTMAHCTRIIAFNISTFCRPHSEFLLYTVPVVTIEISHVLAFDPTGFICLCACVCLLSNRMFYAIVQKYKLTHSILIPFCLHCIQTKNIYTYCLLYVKMNTKCLRN